MDKVNTHEREEINFLFNKVALTQKFIKLFLFIGFGRTLKLKPNPARPELNRSFENPTQPDPTELRPARPKPGRAGLGRVGSEDLGPIKIANEQSPY